MRDYNAIPFKNPKHRHEQFMSPPSAVARFVPNMSMDYVTHNNPRHSSSMNGDTRSSPSVRIETPSQRQQRENASSMNHYSSSSNNDRHYSRDNTSPPPQGSSSMGLKKQSTTSPDNSPQSTANTTYTESSHSPPPDIGQEAILRLQNALDDDAHMEESAAFHDDDHAADRQQQAIQAAVTKSDSVILELRSTVRQLKRQLEKLHEEKESLLDQCQQLQQRDVDTSFNDAASAQDARIGEMQVQLDRAHAQILTADMVRKELEDTLEAEQYTWDLRVQDQERMIQQMQDECVSLADELLHCKKRWNEAEQGWSGQVNDLNSKLDKAMQETQHWKHLQMEDNQDIADLKERLFELEQERSDLQGCLDEALKELEAVDAELQNDHGLNEFRLENERLRAMVEDGEHELMDSLRHLYRWLLERDCAEECEHNTPHDAKGLVAAIRSHLERTPASDRDLAETRKQVENLESQLSVYRGDLKAREEGSIELRQSLKEAVALLKPLQDAVARADKEKLALQKELDLVERNRKDDSEIAQLKKQLQAKEDECNRLQEETESLTIQLSKANMAAATTLMTAQSAYNAESPSLSKAREGLRAKRQMLADAQNRFSSLRSPNREVSVTNEPEQCERGVSDTAEELDATKRDHVKAIQDIREHEIQVHELQNELKVIRGELTGKDVELRALEQALADTKSNNHESDTARYQQAQIRIRNLELTEKSLLDELSVKKATERKLNKSLKEALSLLKPLQQHLEEAEAEKKELRDELLLLRGRDDGQSSYNDSMEPSRVRNLQQTVRQLEDENSRLQDALEDMSQTVSQSHLSGNASTSKVESRMREDFVELKSRYEVTHGRLEDAHVENHALIESLKRREREERIMTDEIKSLREQLAQAQALMGNTAAAPKDDNARNGHFNRYYFQRPRYQQNDKERDAPVGASVRRLT